MASDPEAGSLETRKDAGTDQRAQVKLWTQAIELASDEEKDWRRSAKATYEIFRMEESAKKSVAEVGTPGFNILFSNVETILPAVYNSVPTPDIRRRFGDADPDGKAVSQALERAISAQIDQYDFDREIKLAVKDMLLPGRGVVRVRYEPQIEGEQVVSQGIRCEHVQWDDFRRGPGKTWNDVPWVAFRHHLTRDQLRMLSPEVGDRVNLDVTVRGAKEMAEKDGEQPPELFKRAEVWEIWDKDQKQVCFVAPGHKDQPLLTVDDPLKLEGFWPCPRPLYAIETANSLVPVEEYRAYRDQAAELERVTRRIDGLMKVLKWRGVHDASLSKAFGQLSTLKDGELAPSDQEFAVMQMAGGLDKAIWLMPIEQAAAVLAQLYQQREQIKQTIYEITGIADILRGATNASETATAQQIKAQWGSLRVQARQAEVARFARDLIRIMAELIATTFSVETIAAMTGITLQPQQEQLMRSDFLRSYRVDIETDSTIRADLTRSQEQMSNFVTGLGSFITAVGPAVQVGAMPMDVVADLLGGFARQFKLGKQAEDALDRLSSEAQKKAQAPQAPQGPSPEEIAAQQQQAQAQQQQEAEAAKLQASQQQAHMNAQVQVAKIEADKEIAAMKDATERWMFEQKLVAEAQRADADREHNGQIAREKITASSKPTATVSLDAKSELAELGQAVIQMLNMHQEQNAQIVSLMGAAVDQLSAAASRMGGPKRVVKDARGEVVGIEPIAVN